MSGLPPLTVMCWNVLYKNFHGGRNEAQNRRRLADIMADDMEADVAGLQECMNETQLQEAFGDRMRVAADTDKFNCISYRPSVVEFGGQSGRRYLGDAARDNYSERYVSYAKLKYGGVDFWLFSTHWCLDGPCGGAAGSARHRRSAQVILDLRRELGAADAPTIITADANSHMNAAYDNDGGVQWFLSNGFVIAGKGPMAGGIDYIFVSKGPWEVREHTVGPTWPSDHPSFKVTLTLTGALATTGTPSTTKAVGATTAPLGASADHPLQSTSAPAPAAKPGAAGDRYRKAEPPMKVGGYGGWCTCPSGERYNVGDLWDGCANGPQSLACEGGVPGECERVEVKARMGMAVTCAPAKAPEPQEPAAAALRNNYRKVGNVGAWGGMCTCPDGQSYNVGDRMDACAKGPQSLACEGGVPGECNRWDEELRAGMMVTCGRVQNAASVHEEAGEDQEESPQKRPQEEDEPRDDYRRVPGVGAWGGLCTCPNGRVYNVGDKQDGCKNGAKSLACVGGMPGECQRVEEEARRGMMVTCAQPTEGRAMQA